MKGMQGMTTIIEAQKFAAKTMTEDGLIDLFAGAGLILVGYFWIVDNSAISAIMPFALINMWKVARTRISEPRLGRVTLPKEKRAHILTGRIILAIISLTLLVGVILWLMGGAGDIQGAYYYPLFASGPSLLIAVITFFSAIYLRSLRFYVYAVWLVAADGIAIWLLEGPGEAFVIGGIPLLLTGAVLFAKFLKTHPKEKTS